MNHTTMRQVREIRTKLMNAIQQRPEFNSDSDVINYAVEQLYEDLKRRKLLR